MYALNLDKDGRILSATFPEYAPADVVIVEELPENEWGKIGRHNTAAGQVKLIDHSSRGLPSFSCSWSKR